LLKNCQIVEVKTYGKKGSVKGGGVGLWFSTGIFYYYYFSIFFKKNIFKVNWETIWITS